MTELPTVFDSVGHLHSALLQLDPSQFVSRYLFEPVPYLFATDLDLWVDWKTMLAGKLGVDPHEIILSGSGALGFSLNPNKAFRGFDADPNDPSDIDVCVISEHHFDVAWRFLRQRQTNWLGLSKLIRDAINTHRRSYVFSGTIATDQMLSILSFGKQWQAGLDTMARRDPTRHREIKLRIYRDFDALRTYQSFGIETARTSLMESDVTGESDIVDEDSNDQ